MSDRYAVRTGFLEMPPGASGARKIARTIAGDMPAIVKMAHDSGDAETIMHCPFCGSGQVIARSDGTVECGFCKACFTVQIQPQYPAFPQTIDGVPMKVPGMGPQWPGDPEGQDVLQARDAAEGTDADPDDDGDDDNPFSGGDADSDEDADQEDGNDAGGNGNPFAKKSYRTAHGGLVDLGGFLRHVALESARDREAMLERLRER